MRDAEKEEEKKKTRIKVRPWFDPYWRVKRFTAFAPLRFTYETNTKNRKNGAQKLISRVNYTSSFS